MRMLPNKTSIALIAIAVVALIAPMVPELSFMSAPGLDTLARIVAIPKIERDRAPASVAKRDAGAEVPTSVDP